MEQVVISFCRGSSPPRDQTPISCLAGRFFTIEPPGKPLIKDPRGLTFSPFLSLSVLSSSTWGYSEKVIIYKPGWWLSSWTESASTKILDLPVSRAVTNGCLLFKPPSPWYSCYSSPKRLRSKAKFPLLYSIREAAVSSPSSTQVFKLSISVFPHCDRLQLSVDRLSALAHSWGRRLLPVLQPWQIADCWHHWWNK